VELAAADLATGLAGVRASPSERGVVELVVRRPAVGRREILTEGVLDVDVGLVGDTWPVRPSRRTPDRSPHPEMQLNVMNARVAALVAGPAPERWALAGDQLYVDFDLSEANLPPGTLLAVGSAVIEVTAQPHTGCVKFAARFGRDAMRFVNTADGRALRLRGMNARVVTGGTVRPGDVVAKTPR
jgi:hypothetical protein